MTTDQTGHILRLALQEQLQEAGVVIAELRARVAHIQDGQRLLAHQLQELDQHCHTMGSIYAGRALVIQAARELLTR